MSCKYYIRKMIFKNYHIILAFIYFALLVLYSPLKDDSNKLLKSSQNDKEKGEEEEEVTLSVIEIFDDNEEIIKYSGIEILSDIEEASQTAISNDDFIKSNIIKRS